MAAPAHPESLRIPASIANGLIAHARSTIPNESCALLGGDPVARLVLSLHRARNRVASPYRYDVAPEELVRIVHRIEASGQALLGIFHSHPASPAEPSPTDIRDARWPVVHLVASLAGDGWTMRGWWIEAGRAREVPVRIDEAGWLPPRSATGRGRDTGTPPPAGA